MPRAVFPADTSSRKAPLPFMAFGELLDQSGTTLEVDVPVSIWPAARQSATAGGEAFDHTAEIPLRYESSVVERANLWLVCDGRRYRIVEAVSHPFVPHVALNLRRMVAGG